VWGLVVESGQGNPRRRVMAHWKYQDADGNWYEATAQQMKELITAGKILPDTPVESSEGKRSFARRLVSANNNESAIKKSVSLENEPPKSGEVIEVVKKVEIKKSKSNANDVPQYAFSFGGHTTQQAVNNNKKSGSGGSSGIAIVALIYLTLSIFLTPFGIGIVMLVIFFLVLLPVALIMSWSKGECPDCSGTGKGRLCGTCNRCNGTGKWSTNPRNIPAQPDATVPAPSHTIISKNISDAAEKGTIEDVRYFVEKKRVDVNAQDERGTTPLYYASRSNADINVLKYLISQGADVNTRTKNGYSPMSVANTEEKKHVLHVATLAASPSQYPGFTATQMQRWFYYDTTGKQIAVTGAQIKLFTEWGIITPETIIEKENGTAYPAKQAKGLTFLAAAASAPFISLLLTESSEDDAESTAIGYFEKIGTGFDDTIDNTVGIGKTIVNSAVTCFRVGRMAYKVGKMFFSSDNFDDG